MGEFLLAFPSAVAGACLPFLNALKKYLPLFPFCSFGVTFGLELRFSELSPGTAAKEKNNQLCHMGCIAFFYQSYTFRSSPSRII